MIRKSLLVLALVSASCGPKRAAEPPPEPPPDPAALIAELPRLEARRGAGVDRLIELSRHRAPELRAAVARSLGRVGGSAATARLLELAGDPETEVRQRALWALGISGDAGAAAAIREAYAGLSSPAERALAIQALGRIGGAQELSTITAALADGDGAVRAAAAVAAGMYGRRALPIDDPARAALAAAACMFGRRELPIDDPARAALAAAASDREVDVRLGVAFAFAREHEPPADARAVERLTALSGDPEPEVRAMALGALSVRSGSDALSPGAFLARLNDDDWRVRVRAITGLASESAGAEANAAAAAQLVVEWNRTALEPDGGPRAHVLAEGLRALAPRAADPRVRAAVDQIAKAAAARLDEADLRHGARITASMIHCLAVAAQVRAGGSLVAATRCGGPIDRGWPRHARQQLVAELIGAGAGGNDVLLLGSWQELAADSDPRVRAAAVGQAVALVKRGEPFRGPVLAVLGVVLFEDEIEVAGTAADAIAQLVQLPEVKEEAWELAGRLVERARRGAGDVELELTFLAALRDGVIADGRAQCARAMASPNRTVRETAASCLDAIGVKYELPPVPEPPALPFEPAAPASELLWTLETTRGRVVIRLEPARAPWHVGAIVHLTGKKLYDGLMWHRVVPGFVVQGGAPGDSAWGGPGFVIPAEPSAGRYDAGVVGVADAGWDTGGSQIFAMHARAPHLEGRYTIVGRVVSSQEVVDSLVVGDRILRATIGMP